jgi:hypothetical protein
MAKYKILYWHGIPSQVRATDENGRVNRQLPPHFQEAIDEAAMSLKKIDTDSYTEGFQWGEEVELPGTAEEVAENIAVETAKKYQDLDWRALVEKIKDTK